MLTKANHKQENAMDMVSANGRELLQFNPEKFAKEALNLNWNAYRCRLPKSGSISSKYKSQTISTGEMLSGVINSCLLGNNSLSPVHPLLLLSCQIKRVPCMNL